MATLMELLSELPAPVLDELRAMITNLGPHATPAEMIAAVSHLSPATREATLALLVTHLQEELTTPAAQPAAGDPTPGR
jgi:hypothetical protein